MENCLLGFEMNSKAFIDCMEKYKTEWMYIRIGVEIVFLGFFLWAFFFGGGGINGWNTADVATNPYQIKK